MAYQQHDLVVIGAGPGGYVAAIRAAQLGWNVGLVEKEPQLGGTCLRVGCIPSKALLESSERYVDAKLHLAEYGVSVDEARFDLKAMLQRKTDLVAGLAKGIDGLVKKRKIARYAGLGRIVAPTKVEVAGAGESIVLDAKNILIATGSKVAPLKGVAFDGNRIGGSDEALCYPEVPDRLVVIGAGAIGLELGSVWSRLGSRVIVLEYLDRILPGMDKELADGAQRLLAQQGIAFQLGVRVTGARVVGSKSAPEVEVTHSGGEPIRCDRVLVSVGRLPNTDGLGLEKAGIALDPRGRIPVNADFQTVVPGIFAIGDVIAGPMLAHKAEEEGVACVEKLISGYGHVDYDAIPAVVYTQPEVAAVGKTEEELKAAGVNYRKGVFTFSANGRARALGQYDGRAKVLADAVTDRVLGVHILGPRAGDLIAEAAVAISFGASSEDLARTCHAHPTLAEVLKEACLAVDGRAIHS
ncbi:MAG TPA: dihydrolipoyl dehydrogenase [Planctomycetota bacterium]|nr:dihydrolipoyl dehydrogenase [Planctomycetota bacterium]